MSTIVVIRKAGMGAICADTLTKWGTVKETADYVLNHEKIIQIGENAQEGGFRRHGGLAFLFP